MCGIGGVFLKSGGQVRKPLLKKMGTLMAHRGPDGEGVFSRGTVGLVHRRLSIIDVAGGAQPIADKASEVHIVGNGEIYNYRVLNNRLEAEGVPLKTASDIECALHLYKKHGLDFLRHLHGMYSLAIYDARKKRLVLARDPFGIKPLYYAQTAEGLAFASEPSVLTGANWLPAALNEKALSSYLNRQYVAGRSTLFAGVERLLPGELVVVEAGEIVTRRRHLPDLAPAATLDEAEAIDHFDTLFTQTVKSHLQSEVPYGAFLSGGVDSSAVVVKMAELEEKVRTFTIGFSSDTVADERAAAQGLTETLDTSHTGVFFDEEDFWRLLPHMCHHMDDLVADYAALPLLKLAAEASKSVKVVLSGEGGDEMFAGYGRYQPDWREKWLGRPFGGRGDAAPFRRLFRRPEVAIAPVRPMFPFSLGRLFSPLQKLQALDISGWLPDDLLIKVDRCLMAHGVEGRVPYLDDALAAFAFCLSDDLKIREQKGKWLLKTWLHAHAPGLDVWGKKKGFTVPVAPWLENQRPWLAGYLCSHEAVTAFLKPEKMRKWLSRPLKKRDAKFAFNLLCFALWHDVHIGGKSLKELSLPTGGKVQ